MQPDEIRLTKSRDRLILTYEGISHTLSAEYLRVYSPSAEVQGHWPGEGVLQTGKKHVQIIGIEPVGQYALKIIFNDGHDSGLYTWNYLSNLALEQEKRWQAYLDQLEASHASRE